VNVYMSCGIAVAIANVKVFAGKARMGAQ
jgi:hypothetical protein